MSLSACLSLTLLPQSLFICMCTDLKSKLKKITAHLTTENTHNMSCKLIFPFTNVWTTKPQ